MFYPQNDNDPQMRNICLTELTKDGEKVDPSTFDLLKVLGQGSFGKVQYSNNILTI